MIPLIGTMIGVYIIVQCVTIASRTGERSEHAIARVLAVVSVFAVMWFVYSLWQTSAEYERAVLPTSSVPP